MKCKLCLNNAELRNSHVIPEFLYKPLYDSKHRAMGVHGQGHKKWQYLQKGLREKLLCQNCEQLLNDFYERYFHEFWFVNSPIPFKFETDKIYEISGIDYAKFKLFHLSILFRASISSLPTFKQVALGLHEDKIRVMLLNHNPGMTSDYQIYAYVVVKKDGSPVQNLISQPGRSKSNNHTIYNIMFGGCEWHYMVSSHQYADFKKIALRNNGIIYLSVKRWEAEPLIQGLKQIFRE
ncbi:hypothetical protein ACFL0H_00110 [Thermodesulfobacteriota bacterium]